MLGQFSDILHSFKVLTPDSENLVPRKENLNSEPLTPIPFAWIKATNFSDPPTSESLSSSWLVDSFRAVSGALVLSFAGFVLIKKYSSRQDDISKSSANLIPSGGYQYPECSEDYDDSKDLRNDAMTEKLLKMSGLKTCDRMCQEFDF